MYNILLELLYCCKNLTRSYCHITGWKKMALSPFHSFAFCVYIYMIPKQFSEIQFGHSYE